VTTERDPLQLDATRSAAAHPRQLHAMELLVAGKSDAEVASELGIDRSTIWRWRQNPTFADEVVRLQHLQREAAFARMAALVTAAVDVIGAVMTDPEAPASVRLRAASEVLDRTFTPHGRLKLELESELNSFFHTMSRRLTPDAFRTLVEACRGAELEPYEPTLARRPRLRIEFPGSGKDED